MRNPPVWVMILVGALAWSAAMAAMASGGVGWLVYAAVTAGIVLGVERAIYALHGHPWQSGE